MKNLIWHCSVFINRPEKPVFIHQDDYLSRYIYSKSQFGVLLHILQIEILKSLISSSGSLFVIVNLDKNIFLTPYFQHFRNCVLYFVGYCLLGRYHLSSLEDCLYQGFGRDFSLSNPCLNLTV